MGFVGGWLSPYPFSRERNAFGGNKALHVPVDGATDTGMSALLNINFCLP